MDLRCFIAVEMPGPLKAEIGGLIETLRQTGADVKWVKKKNLHITLKFLGNTEESSVDDIKNSLTRKLSHYEPFYIRISGTGTFPKGRFPRVIWIGLDESEIFNHIHGTVEEGMSELGFKPDDRFFSPHLTIGRVRSNKGMHELLAKIDEMRSAEFGALDISGVSLIKSELHPAGPEYERLAEIKFVGRDNVEQGS
jgi:2'-5' RNA ligase